MSLVVRVLLPHEVADTEALEFAHGVQERHGNDAGVAADFDGAGNSRSIHHFRHGDAEDVGGTNARTMYLDVETGEVRLSTAGVEKTL